MQNGFQTVWYKVHHAGAKISTIVYVVEGETQSLLGLRDSEKLGIIRVHPEGEKAEVVVQLSIDKKQPSTTEGIISGGQTAAENERKIARILAKYPAVFDGLGLAKVEPIHIEVDPDIRPIQQKQDQSRCSMWRSLNLTSRN